MCSLKDCLDNHICVFCSSESQVHAHIISYLKQEMRSVFRKDNKKKNLIYQLPVIFSKIQLQHNISAGDFPDCTKMQVWLSLQLQQLLI